MKSEPYKQFITRNTLEISEVLSTFHELNHYYNNHLIISMDSEVWELFDLRTSNAVCSYPIKQVCQFTQFMKNLLHDMVNTRTADYFFDGRKKLKRSEYFSIKRILNLYGFDEYFIKNRKLINYIIYGEINKE